MADNIHRNLRTRKDSARQDDNVVDKSKSGINDEIVLSDDDDEALVRAYSLGLPTSPRTHNNSTKNDQISPTTRQSLRSSSSSFTQEHHGDGGELESQSLSSAIEVGVTPNTGPKPRGRKKKVISSASDEITAEQLLVASYANPLSTGHPDANDSIINTSVNENVSMPDDLENSELKKMLTTNTTESAGRSKRNKSTSASVLLGLVKSRVKQIKEMRDDSPSGRQMALVSRSSAEVSDSPITDPKPSFSSPFPQSSDDSLFLKPFEIGWTREMVKRYQQGPGKPNFDIYYYSPDSRKLRSMREVAEYLQKTNSVIGEECFTFRKYSVYKEPYEIVREARPMAPKSSTSLSSTKSTVSLIPPADSLPLTEAGEPQVPVSQTLEAPVIKMEAPVTKVEAPVAKRGRKRKIDSLDVGAPEDKVTPAAKKMKQEVKKAVPKKERNQEEMRDVSFVLSDLQELNRGIEEDMARAVATDEQGSGFLKGVDNFGDDKFWDEDGLEEVFEGVKSDDQSGEMEVSSAARKSLNKEVKQGQAGSDGKAGERVTTRRASIKRKNLEKDLEDSEVKGEESGVDSVKLSSSVDKVKVVRAAASQALKAYINKALRPGITAEPHGADLAKDSNLMHVDNAESLDEKVSLIKNAESIDADMSLSSESATVGGQTERSKRIRNMSKSDKEIISSQTLSDKSTRVKRYGVTRNIAPSSASKISPDSKISGAGSVSMAGVSKDPTKKLELEKLLVEKSTRNRRVSKVSEVASSKIDKANESEAAAGSEYVPELDIVAAIAAGSYSFDGTSATGKKPVDTADSDEAKVAEIARGRDIKRSKSLASPAVIKKRGRQSLSDKPVTPEVPEAEMDPEAIVAAYAKGSAKPVKPRIPAANVSVRLKPLNVDKLGKKIIVEGEGLKQVETSTTKLTVTSVKSVTVSASIKSAPVSASVKSAPVSASLKSAPVSPSVKLIPASVATASKLGAESKKTVSSILKEMKAGVSILKPIVIAPKAAGDGGKEGAAAGEAGLKTTPGPATQASMLQLNNYKKSFYKVCGLECVGRLGIPPSLYCDSCMSAFHPDCIGVRQHHLTFSFLCLNCRVTRRDQEGVVYQLNNFSTADTSVSFTKTLATGETNAKQNQPVTPKGSAVIPTPVVEMAGKDQEGTEVTLPDATQSPGIKKPGNTSPLALVGPGNRVMTARKESAWAGMVDTDPRPHSERIQASTVLNLPPVIIEAVEGESKPFELCVVDRYIPVTPAMLTMTRSGCRLALPEGSLPDQYLCGSRSPLAFSVDSDRNREGAVISVTLATPVECC